MATASPKMKALFEEFKNTKPWFVYNATRTSAEDILYKLGKIGSCLVRPSSKPNCFALSHRAYEDMIGHALIFVKPNGFQLETKPTIHPTIDALLASLEPDVEIASSFFNTALKSKPALPSKQGVGKTSDNKESTMSLSQLITHLTSLFPEKSDDSIRQAATKANGSVAKATELLTSASSSMTSPPISPTGPRRQPPKLSQNNNKPTQEANAGRLRASALKAPKTENVDPFDVVMPDFGDIDALLADEEGADAAKPAQNDAVQWNQPNWSASPLTSADVDKSLAAMADKPLPTPSSKTLARTAANKSDKATDDDKNNDTNNNNNDKINDNNTNDNNNSNNNNDDDDDDANSATPSAADVLAANEAMSNKPDYKKKEAEKVSSDLILVEEDGKVFVKAGTLQRLVERVTTPEYADPNFLLQFLLTYRSFTTHDALLGELIQRYDATAPPEHDAADWAKKLIKIRLRVINLLRTWIGKHWRDFDGNDELQAKVEKFVENTVRSSNASLADNLIKMLMAKREETEVKEKQVIFSQKAPKPLAPVDKPIKDTFNWMDYHPTEIARQITLIEYDMYKAITPFEFLENGWSRKDKDQRAPNILKMTRRFNKLSSWVQTQICIRDDLRERVHAMQRFIEIADRCRDYNNINAISEIVSGLNSSPVHRLKNTWAALPQRARDTFHELDTITQPNGSYKNFREYLHTCKPPCIPYLGVYLTDLTFIEDGCKDVVMQGEGGQTQKLVNFDKCFPESDHQLLTNNGFMSLHDVLAHVQHTTDNVVVDWRGLQLASYDEHRDCLVYETPSALVINPAHGAATNLVELSQAEWFATPRRSGVSVVATSTHDMYVKSCVSSSSSSSSTLGYSKMSAARVVQSRVPFRVLTRAYAGIQPSQKSKINDSIIYENISSQPIITSNTQYNNEFLLESTFIEELNLNIENIEYFLQLYGFCFGRLFGHDNTAQTLSQSQHDFVLHCAHQLQLSVNQTDNLSLSIDDIRWHSIMNNDSDQFSEWVWNLDRDGCRKIVGGLLCCNAARRHDIPLRSAAQGDAIVRVCLHAGLSAIASAHSVHIDFLEHTCESVLDQRVDAVRTSGEVNRRYKHDRTWCVTMPSTFVVVRRVVFDVDCNVVCASRPTIQGNCRKTARAIQEISQYQDEPFNLTPISYMREALTDLDGEHEDVNYKRSLVIEPRGAPPPDEEDLRRSRMPPKKKLFAKSGDKERITEKERFVGDSPLASAKLVDNIYYEAKSALAVMESRLELLPSEMNSFRISGPTADERRLLKDYVLRAESVQDMAEWMQALLMAGVGGDASLSESLAISNVYDRGGDFKAGFLSMRGAGSLIKSAWQRRWFVLDKKQQLLSHGPLVAPYPEVDANAVAPPDQCVFWQQLFGDAPPSDTDLFACNTCAAEESQAQGEVLQFAVCTGCLINCHLEHDVLLARRRKDSSLPSTCGCRRCVKKVYKSSDAVDDRTFKKKSSFINRRFGRFGKTKDKKDSTVKSPETTKRKNSNDNKDKDKDNNNEDDKTVSPLASPRGASGADDTLKESSSLIDSNNSNNVDDVKQLFRSSSSPRNVSTSSDGKPARPANAIEHVRVIQSYDAEDANELTIEEGNTLWIYRKNDETGWWLGEVIDGPNAGKKGWSPMDFLQVIP